MSATQQQSLFACFHRHERRYLLTGSEREFDQCGGMVTTHRKEDRAAGYCPRACQRFDLPERSERNLCRALTEKNAMALPALHERAVGGVRSKSTLDIVRRCA